MLDKLNLHSLVVSYYLQILVYIFVVIAWNVQSDRTLLIYFTINTLKYILTFK